MELSYTFFYIESNIVCLIIFALLLFRSIRGVDRQEKQRVFDAILISHMFYFVSDMFWVLILGDVIAKTVFSVAFINILNAVFLCLVTFFWFVYVELSQGEKYIKNLQKRMLLFIPSIVIVCLITILFIFFRDYMMTDLEPTAFYYALFISVPVMYILTAAVRSFYRAFRKENFANRKTYLACAFYPVGVSVFGVLQTMWLKAPLFCFGCTIVMIYVYIVSLDDQVSTDPLTGLNNRAQLRRFVSTDPFWTAEDRASFILMLDLNKFKMINDRYGHTEGDIAIMRTAAALKAACSGSRTRPFIARYGGDEFIVIARTSDEREVLKLCDKIRTSLSDMNREAGVDYELSLSIGYARYDGDPSSFQSCLKKADEALYKQKEEYKASS